MTPSPNAPSRFRRWLICLLLFSPVLGLYGSHWMGDRGDPSASPTGFIQYDMAYYLSNAREHFDSGRWTLTYGNAFSLDPSTPRIYFQPMTLVLGGMLRLTGLEPGLLFVLFGLAIGVVCIRVAMALFEESIDLGTCPRRLTFLCFVWGGGLLAITGVAHGLWTGEGLDDWLRFDPFEGWWFLNFGRNLVYPTEALYHALGFGCVLASLRSRFRLATLLLVLLSASHPFAGIQFLLIVSAWSTLERFVLRNRAVPWQFVLACLLLTALHLGYYLLFLPTSPEHASVMEQWTLPWVLGVENMIPAYALVLALTLARFRSRSRAAEVLRSPRGRLLLTWFSMSFLLANHDWFLTAHQPLHFTRGNLWVPLFLLGAPTLVGLLEWCRRRPAWLIRFALPALILCGFLVDNTTWIASRANAPLGLYLSEEHSEVLSWLNAQPDAGDAALLVSNDRQLAYVATAFTRLRAWHSHWACTPFAEQRWSEIMAFVRGGSMPPASRERHLFVVLRRNGSAGRTLAFPGLPAEAFRAGNLHVFHRPPDTASGQ